MKKRDILISIAIIAAAVLVFHFYSRRQGYIKIETPGVEMELSGGWFSRAKIDSGPEPVKVNAQIYRPTQLSITAKQDSNIWRLSSVGPWGELAKIKVKNNETTVLKPGPPFAIKSEVYGGGSQVSISHSIIGRAGEHYSTMVMKNGKRLAAPKVKIVDKAGNTLASGKFEYG